MTTAATGAQPLRKPLRLWPGVVAVALLWLARFGLKAAIPGFAGFRLGAMAGLAGALAVLLWWVLLSRARWSERFGAIGLMALALGATWQVRHESMGPFWLVLYAIPLLCLAFVVWAVASRQLAPRARRLSMVGTIVLATGLWTLVRTEGISGDHVATFAWRWSLSPEERLLSSTGPGPASVVPSLTPVTAESPINGPEIRTLEKPVMLAPGAAVSEKAREPLVPSAPGDAPAARLAVPAVVTHGPDWRGFRGSDRDGIVHGVHIRTDWSRSAPIELWRRPIGPGWSSFAVSGGLLYTQEQRGDDEVVACYKAATGEPVWTHRDATRFFESNGGAGPRGTPTLSDGRVYTFGATGMLNALDAGSGAVLWSRNAAADTSTEIPIWGFASSPLVVGDVVIVAVAGQLVAYDRATGNPRWFGPVGGASYSSPHQVTIDGVAQILLMNDAGVVSLAPASGMLLWDYAWPGLTIVQPARTADDGVLLTRIDNGTRRIAVAHDAGGWRAEERWTSNALKPYFNDFVVHKRYAFGFDGRILACISLEDGTRIWKGGRYGNGQLVLLPEQDLLLVLTEEGELVLVGATPDRFTELGRIRALEGKTWNHPVVVGDILLVRNGEEMAAFRLPLADQ